MTYLRRPELVDDLAQDVFLSAFRDLKDYGGGGSFRVWLLGIARHRALKHLRDDGRRRSREHRSVDQMLVEWRVEMLESHADLDERDRMLRALEGCLAKLPVDSASIVREFYFGHLPMTDIAGRRAKSEGALRMTLLRIRQSLRACVEKTLMAAT
jgi:RNA polymerase sigma-70 factor (ECF subfamily)